MSVGVPELSLGLKNKHFQTPVAHFAAAEPDFVQIDFIKLMLFNQIKNQSQNHFTLMLGRNLEVSSNSRPGAVFL